MNLIANIVFTVGIYVLVRHPSDYLIAALLQAGGKVIAGVLGVIILLSSERVRFSLPTSESNSSSHHRWLAPFPVIRGGYVLHQLERCGAWIRMWDERGRLLQRSSIRYSPPPRCWFRLCVRRSIPMCAPWRINRASLPSGYLRKAMVVIGGITLVGGLVVIPLSPVIVRLAMGPKYIAAIPVLQFYGFDSLCVRNQQHLWHSRNAEFWHEAVVQPNHSDLRISE